MTRRSAIQSNAVIVFAVLAFAGWIVLKALDVYSRLGPLDSIGAGPLGQAAPSGIVGLVVMAIMVVLLVVLYAEIAEVEPGPERFPPQN